MSESQWSQFAAFSVMAVIFTGGAALPFVVVAGVVIAVLGAMDGSENHAHATDQQPHYLQSNASRPPVPVPSSTPMSSDAAIEDEYEGLSDQIDFDDERFAHVGYVSDEHPLADSFDPDWGMSFRDYCDNQMSDD